MEYIEDVTHGHAGGSATAGVRFTTQVASFLERPWCREEEEGKRSGEGEASVPQRERQWKWFGEGVGSSWPVVGGPRQAAAASSLARACSGCR